MDVELKAKADKYRTGHVYHSGLSLARKVQMEPHPKVLQIT
jgi:hypothetical protein